MAERFYSTYGIEQHAKRYHNSHWFDPNTKRFFNSRIHSNVYPCVLNPFLTLFVSSERNNDVFSNPNNQRFYTIRCYDSRNGEIDTIGEYQQYSYASTAHRNAQRIAKTLVSARDNANQVLED